ncbi:hypothetical protein HLV35_07480 [Eggerthellaceae bacterium zg-997]|nr:hypothetical protein [Eggerthellaceae bacterium zg-997]
MPARPRVSERNRLRKLVADLPDERRAALMPIIDQCAVMHEQLLAANEAMDGEPLVIPFDNGGGQSGVRENPAYPAYEKLFRAYLSGMQPIVQALGATGSKRAAAAEAASPEAASAGGRVAERRRRFDLYRGGRDAV